MSHISYNIRRIWLLFLLAFLCIFVAGCGSGSSDESAKGKPERDPNAQPRDNTPVIIPTETPGEILFENELVSLDCSNASSGYISLTYSGSNEKVKFQINTPDDVTYTYLVSEYNSVIIFPLTSESGEYIFTLLESVDIEENMYAIIFQQTADVQITDEFLPYLTPNIYTKFQPDSKCISKGQELAKDCYCDLDVIENVYTYVTKNVTYDNEKAQNISYGYIPDPDKTYESGTGICFDYAALMTAMLRSQRIPTKLEVGYAGEVYHAWISCYVEEIGWVDNIIEFDGKSWSLMDPTLAANNNRKDVQEYIGDGSKYLVKYTY